MGLVQGWCAVPGRAHGSDLGKEGRLDKHLLDRSNLGRDTEVVPLQQIAEAIAVNEVDWRSAVASRFLLSIR